jgi:hypothetical protein
MYLYCKASNLTIIYIAKVLVSETHAFQLFLYHYSHLIIVFLLLTSSRPWHDYEAIFTSFGLVTIGVSKAEHRIPAHPLLLSSAYAII